MERLLDKLMRYCASDALPMHMPGHKRNSDILPLPSPTAIDITEIDGFDNLHGAEDILLRCQQRAARVFGADETHFLVNGSSCGILAAITACVPRGGTLLMGRNCHKSALHAITVGGIIPKYVYPEFYADDGISGAISPDDVAAALDADPSIRCVFVTSPTYEGVISDIAAIARICHRHQAILIVDEAHGAHLGFGGFPASAIRCGADIAIQSVHKTLGSLTQTALLHTSGPRVDRERLRRMLTVYQTSSPSYILMASIDECVCRMAVSGKAECRAWLDRAAQFHMDALDLQHLSVIAPMKERYDLSKIVISTLGADIDGPSLQQRLREEYRIELEMASAYYVIAMTGMGDTDESLARLKDALFAVDRTLTAAPAIEPVDPMLPRPVMALPPCDAEWLPAEDIPVVDAAGRICAETVFAYPPGIPLIVPGEVIDAGHLKRLLAQKDAGVALHSTTEGLPRRIRVIR